MACTEAALVRSKRYREANRGKAVAATRRWQLKNPERYAATQKARHARLGPAYVRFVKYGLSAEDFSQILGEQLGLCAACGGPLCMSAKKGAADSCVVDHDHAKKKGDAGFVRGLIHNSCNIALGALNDDPARLRACADYLEVKRG